MENATKALLIAAAVLVAIVLIAGGVILLKNASSTTSHIDETDKAISLATDEALRKYQKNYISKDEFNDFFENIGGKTTGQLINGILNDKNTQIRNQVEISGYIYNGKRSEFFRESTVIEANQRSNNRMEFENYWKNTTLPFLLNNNKLNLLPNAKDMDAIKQSMTDFYNSKTGNSKTVDEFMNLRLPTSSYWFFLYDNEGYINKACCIYSIQY